jgi:hypothetical protein
MVVLIGKLAVSLGLLLLLILILQLDSFRLRPRQFMVFSWATLILLRFCRVRRFLSDDGAVSSIR